MLLSTSVAACGIGHMRRPRWPGRSDPFWAPAEEFCRHSNATRDERTKIMKRRYLAQALLVASLAAAAATGYAQTNTNADQTPGSPGAAAPEGGTGPTVGTGATAGSGTYSTTPSANTQPGSLPRMRAYEQARANCEAGPAAQRSECQSALTKQYTGIPPMCQKLTGNALDACVHGLDSASGGSVAK
jgi:hypothetical protein